MGQLEERIVASLQRLRAEEPECERGMFVFPTTLMNGVADALGLRDRTLRVGDVVLFCRAGDEERGLRA